MSKLNELKYYQNYHKHTSLSNKYNKDSALVHQDYFKDTLSRFSDVPQIYSTMEHGWQGTYFRIYNDLEKFNKDNNTNIKFVFGTEMYWVKDRLEKDSANCHIVLLARNERGRKAINKTLSIASKDGFYYKVRIDIELLLSLPKDDVMVTTACLAFWNKYEDIDDIVLQLNNHFTHFYLEVQANNTQKQIEVNEHILELSKEHNIPLIAGIDSHYLNESDSESRDDLLLSNKISYPEENGWYMDVPTIDVLIERFQEQGVLSDDEIYEAINNTNDILEFEDIKLDRSLKVPVPKMYRNLTQAERNKEFVNILKKEWVLQKSDVNMEKHAEYKKEINHDIREILDCEMSPYFLTSYWTMKNGQEKYGGQLTPTGRGCFTKDAKVKTHRGTLGISNVEVGDMVVGDDLQWHEVIDTMNYTINEELIEFKYKNQIGALKSKCTLDHKVLVFRNDERIYIQAQNLLIGDLVCSYDAKGWVYIPIVEIKRDTSCDTTTVYDFTVEDCHSYLMNDIIVHNSAVSMYINKLLRLTKVDKVNSPVIMYSERFLTANKVLESKTLPD